MDQETRHRFLHFVILGALIGLMSIIPPLSRPLSDFNTYYETTNNWTQIYTPVLPGFYYLPWALFMIKPFTLLPVRVGWAVFNLLSMLILSFGIVRLIEAFRWNIVAVALLNLPVALLVLLGQWDGLMVGAACLAIDAFTAKKSALLGIILAILITKPIAGWIFLILLLVGISQWNWRDRIYTVIPSLICLLVSVLIWGNWFEQYVKFVATTPPKIISELVMKNGKHVPIEPIQIPVVIMIIIGSIVAWGLVRQISIRIHVARSRHIIPVELSRLLRVYYYLEFEARFCLRRRLRHRGKVAERLLKRPLSV